MSDWLRRPTHGPATSLRVGQVWCHYPDHTAGVGLIVAIQGTHRGKDTAFVVWFWGGGRDPSMGPNSEDFFHLVLDHVHEPEGVR